MIEDDGVIVPRWALAYILEYGNFADEGPLDEAWISSEMARAIVALEEALNDRRTNK